MLEWRLPVRAAVAAVALAMISLTLGGAGAAPASAGTAGVFAGTAPARVRPIVLFPAFHFTKLRVTVRNQEVDPACPSSGHFEDWYGVQVSGPFTQVCRDELLTLRYRDRRGVPMAKRFSNQRGVHVRLKDYGTTESAPFYDTMYRSLVDAGYVRDKTLRVAGYDSRLTPDIGHFLSRTKRLIERTYRSNGDRRVHLVGHSNGPLYAQYLLTHTSAAWKAKYIHGFTPIAGNLPGQGLLYSVFFTGLNVADFGYPTTRANARSSARMYLSAPSSYMSAADPAVFGRREVVVGDASTGRSYTPSDYRALFADAHLPRASRIAKHYIGLVRFTDRRSFPDVDVYAERGSGLSTAVGATLPSLAVGRPVTASTPFLFRDGDGNQEDITNTAIRVWSRTPCFRFSLRDNPGVGHFDLPSDPGVLSRLAADAQRPRSACQ